MTVYKDTYSKLYSLLNSRTRRNLGLLLFGMIISGFLEVIGIGIMPVFIQLIVDPSKLNNAPVIGDRYAFETLSQRLIFIYGSMAVILVILIKNALVFFFKYIQIRFSFGIQKEFGRRLFRAYLNAPYLFHVKLNSANALNRLSAEIKIVVNQLIITALTLVSDAIMTLMICATLFITHASLTGILFSVFIVSAMLFFRFIKNKTNLYGRENQRHRGELLKVINRALGGLKDARIMKREKSLFRMYNKSIMAIAKTASFNELVNRSIKPFFEVMVILSIIIITVVLLSAEQGIEAVLPILTLFAMAALKLMPTVNQILATLQKINYNKFAFYPVYEDLKRLEEINEYDYEKNTKEVKNPLTKSIKIEGLSFQYPESDEYVLRDINLEIKKGEAIGFVGGSGAGKSTLIDIIIGLINPTSGTISVDQKSIYDDLTGWQLNIGYIPQSIFLADDTVKANIAFCLDEVDEKRLKEVIKAAHVDVFMDSLQDGLDTVVGENGARLSGGQRQRIGIARAIYNNPDVLVMDEATSALDNISERIVVQAMDKMKGERTILMIAHRLSTVKNCDRIVVMEHGKIVAIDTYDNLLKHHEVFQKMAVNNDENVG